jgi:hypothetical protein
LRADAYLASGALALLGTIPLLVMAVGRLAERDYVGGGLLIFAGAAIGHMGLELVALGEHRRPTEADDEGEG